MKVSLNDILKLKFTIIIEILFFPIVALWRMPFSWVKSLWFSRIIFINPENYMGFFPRHALNTFFYRTQLLNIFKYGKSGISPIVGLGEYKLNQWFHLSIFCSYLYSKSGSIVMILGTLTWSLSHLSWLNEENNIWVYLITISLIISSTTYCMAFRIQNYQIIGWMLLPFGLFSIIGLEFFPQIIIWYFISLLNLTVAIFSFPILLVLIIENYSTNSLYIFLIIFINIMLKFLPLLFDKNIIRTLSKISKMIGVTKYKTKYIRKSKSFTIKNLYFLTLYLIPVVNIYFQYGYISYLFLAWCLVLINQTFIRFADDQSSIIFYASILVFSYLRLEPNILNLTILWITLNPIPIMVWLDPKKNNLNPTKIAIRKPFDHSEMEKDWEDFFLDLRNKSRVLFAFNDPKGVYDTLFDGYSMLFQLPIHVASKREIHVLPNWYAVEETNYPNSPVIWGRKVSEVLKNLKSWNTKYVVIYQDKKSKLNIKWDKNFKCLKSLDFSKYSLNESIVEFNMDLPKFFLLEKK